MLPTNSFDTSKVAAGKDIWNSLIFHAQSASYLYHVKGVKSDNSLTPRTQ